MALTISAFDTNKNAVIFQYSHLYPLGPAYEGEKPTSCVIQYFGYCIRASVYEKGFRVFNSAENLSILLPSLREAKNFVKSKVNKKRTLF